MGGMSKPIGTYEAAMQLREQAKVVYWTIARKLVELLERAIRFIFRIRPS